MKRKNKKAMTVLTVNSGKAVQKYNQELLEDGQTL